jgi:ABC-2 type transport system permease protein
LWAGTWLGTFIVGPFQVTEADLAIFKRLPFKVVVDPALLHIDVSVFGTAIINVAALIFAMSGLTMALSSIGRFRNRVIGLAILIALVMFLINVVGQLWDVLAPVRPFTTFFYYQPQAIALHNRWTTDPGLLWGIGSWPVNVIGVLMGVGAAGYLIAFTVFTRRDLPAPL